MTKIQISLIFSLFFMCTQVQSCHRKYSNLSDKSKSTSEQLSELRPKFIRAHKNNPAQQQHCCKVTSLAAFLCLHCHLTLTAATSPIYCLYGPFAGTATAVACHAQYNACRKERENHDLNQVKAYLAQNFSQSDIEQYFIDLKKDDRSLECETMYYNLMYYDPICHNEMEEKQKGQFYYHDFLKYIKDAAPSRPSMQ